MSEQLQNELISPTYAVMFKLVFADPKNEPLLRSLLAAILELPTDKLGSIKYLNTEVLPNEVGGKFSRLDLRLDVNGRQVDVEIQKSREKDFKQRSLYYWSSIYRSELQEGEEHEELVPVICINLVNFQMFDCEAYYSDFGVLERTRHELLHKDLQIIMLELTKIPRLTANLTDDMKLLWMQFFKAKREEEFAMLESAGNQEISAAVAKVRHYSADEKVRALAQREKERLYEEARAMKSSYNDGKKDGKAEGHAEGLTEGIEIGELRAKQENAWNMLQKGFDIATISEITGLSEMQISELQQQMKANGDLQN